MNWPVLKDNKWWISLIITLIFLFASIILAYREIEYWVPLLIISILISSYSVKRASKLTYGDKK